MNSDRRRRIEQRAYALWEAEGYPHGKHEDHWHRAAYEIDAEETARRQEPNSAAEQPADFGGFAEPLATKMEKEDSVGWHDSCCESSRSGPCRTGAGPIRAGIAGSHPDLVPGPALLPAQPPGRCLESAHSGAQLTESKRFPPSKSASCRLPARITMQGVARRHGRQRW